MWKLDSDDDDVVLHDVRTLISQRAVRRSQLHLLLQGRHERCMEKRQRLAGLAVPCRLVGLQANCCQ